MLFAYIEHNIRSNPIGVNARVIGERNWAQFLFLAINI